MLGQHSTEKQSTKDKELSQEETLENTQIVRTDGSGAYLNGSASQNSQAKRQKQSQSQHERRKIRTTYRKLITDTSVKKQELIQPEADGLVRALEKADSLYQKVSMPREAALDSEFLSLASQLGVEQTSRLNTGFKTRDPNEFVTKLRHYMLKDASLNIGSSQEVDQELTEGLNWDAVSRQAIQLYQRTPTISFLYGPLVAEPTVMARKERQRRERDKVGEKVVPEEIRDAQLDQEALDKATSKRVEDLRGYLDKAKHIDFLKFVIDPESFSQTVENIFHYAFLIKDGQAVFKLDDKGAPVAEPAQPPLQEDYTSGKAERRQCVIAITYDMWNQLKEKYNITKGYLPHRKPGTHIVHADGGQKTEDINSLELNESPSIQKNANGNTRSNRHSRTDVDEDMDSVVDKPETAKKKHLKKKVRKSSDSSESEPENNLVDTRKSRRIE